MSNKPKITKADMNKILNCQDQLQSTLAGLVKATKSFQDASDKVEKEAAGFSITKRGSDYYQRIQDKKALNAASITIDKITKDYTADISAIKKNIGILKSQEIYQKRIKDLVKYGIRYPHLSRFQRGNMWNTGFPLFHEPQIYLAAA